MKFYLISDNTDTLLGMRIAGIEGVLAHTKEEVSAALEKAIANESVAVVLMTEKLVSLCHDRVYDLKMRQRRPLVVEVPDRHGSSGVIETISRYVEEAIGIQL